MEGSIHTFLFADLVGYTALAELEGDSRALEVALALQRRVGGLLGQHRAEQVKAIGDGIMIRCDRPADAVKLGLCLVDELAQEGDFPPVRVGIHTGPALESDGDWYGRAVNVAARLCSSAPGGEVMVSDSTRAGADGLSGVQWGPRELHWLRNVSRPIGAYSAMPRREAARNQRRLLSALSLDGGRQLLSRVCAAAVQGGAAV